MKHLKRVLLIALFTVGISGMAHAQKVAHVNFGRVIANMPETRALSADIAKSSKTYKDDIDGMVKKYKSKVQKYGSEQATVTQEENIKRMNEVKADEQRIAQAEQAAMQDLNEKQNKGALPILEKARKAIKELAKEKGITYVLDANPAPGATLLVAEGEDLYDALVAKLGLLEDVKEPNAKQ